MSVLNSTLNNLPGRSDGWIVPGDPASAAIALPVDVPSVTLNIADRLSVAGTLDTAASAPGRQVWRWRLTAAQVTTALGTPAETVMVPWRATTGVGDDLSPLAAGELRVVSKWTAGYQQMFDSALVLIGPPGASTAEAEDARDAALLAQAAAEDARDAAQDIADTLGGTPDGAVAALVDDPDSATRLALSSTIGSALTQAEVIGDGNPHPLADHFPDLASAQVRFPAATALTDEWDWAAIQSAISAYGGAVIPVGKHCKINKTITLANGEWLCSVGGHARVTQATDNIPIVSVTGLSRVEGLSLAYLTSQPSAHTNAACIYMSNVRQGSRFRNLELKFGAYGFLAKIDTYVFSTTFDTIEILGFSISAFDVCTNGSVGNTGNVISNLYIHNNEAVGGTQGTSPDANGRYASTAAPFRIETWDDGVINQLNIEWCRAPSAIHVASSSAQTFTSVHVERFVAASSYNGLIALHGSVRIGVNGLTVRACDFLAANGAATYALFRFAGSGSSLAMGVDLNGANLVNNTADIPLALALANNIGTTRATFGARLIATNITRGNFTIDQNGDSTPLPLVWSINGVPNTPELYASNVSGYRYTPSVAAGATGAGTMTEGLVAGARTIPARACTVDRLAMKVITQGSAGAVIRLGLYDFDVRTGTLMLLADAGTVDATTPGVKIATLSPEVQVSAGQAVMVVAVCQGSASTKPQVQIDTGFDPAWAHQDYGQVLSGIAKGCWVAASGGTPISVSDALPASASVVAYTAGAPSAVLRSHA